jgi:hypothetical protein
MPEKKKANAAFLKMAQAPLRPSPQLAEVLGSDPHIPAAGREEGLGLHQEHKLQDPKEAAGNCCR